MHSQIPYWIFNGLMAIFSSSPDPTTMPLNVTTVLPAVLLNATAFPSTIDATSTLNPTQDAWLPNAAIPRALTNGTSSQAYQLLATYVRPLDNGANAAMNRTLVGVAQIGTPARPYRMIFDNKRINNSIALLANSAQANVNVFNSSLSTSFLGESHLNQVEIVNASGTFIHTVKTETAHDVFWVGGSSAFKQNFSFAREVDHPIREVLRVVPADGLLSLTSDTMDSQGQSTFLNSAMGKSNSSVVTIYLEPVNLTQKDPDAMLTFGQDDIRCNAKHWVFVNQLKDEEPKSRYQEWTFFVKSLVFSYGRILPDGSVDVALSESIRDPKLQSEVIHKVGGEQMKGSTSTATKTGTFQNTTYTDGSKIESNGTYVNQTIETVLDNKVVERSHNYTELAGHRVVSEPKERPIKHMAALVITDFLSTAPVEHVQFIADVVGAVKEADGGLYTLPCANVVSDLLLSFILDEQKQVTLKPKDYLMQSPADPAKCVLMFTEGSTFHPSRYNWAIGGHFLNSYCAQLDVVKRQVGFSRVIAN